MYYKNEITECEEMHSVLNRTNSILHSCFLPSYGLTTLTRCPYTKVLCCLIQIDKNVVKGLQDLSV